MATGGGAAAERATVGDNLDDSQTTEPLDARELVRRWVAQNASGRRDHYGAAPVPTAIASSATLQPNKCCSKLHSCLTRDNVLLTLGAVLSTFVFNVYLVQNWKQFPVPYLWTAFLATSVATNCAQAFVFVKIYVNQLIEAKNDFFDVVNKWSDIAKASLAVCIMAVFWLGASMGFAATTPVFDAVVGIFSEEFSPYSGDATSAILTRISNTVVFWFYTLAMAIDITSKFIKVLKNAIGPAQRIDVEAVKIANDRLDINRLLQLMQQSMRTVIVNIPNATEDNRAKQKSLFQKLIAVLRIIKQKLWSIECLGYLSAFCFYFTTLDSVEKVCNKNFLRMHQMPFWLITTAISGLQIEWWSHVITKYIGGLPNWYFYGALAGLGSHSIVNRWQRIVALNAAISECLSDNEKLKLKSEKKNTIALLSSSVFFGLLSVMPSVVQSLASGGGTLDLLLAVTFVPFNTMLVNQMGIPDMLSGGPRFFSKVVTKLTQCVSKDDDYISMTEPNLPKIVEKSNALAAAILATNRDEKSAAAADLDRLYLA